MVDGRCRRGRLFGRRGARSVVQRALIVPLDVVDQEASHVLYLVAHALDLRAGFRPEIEGLCARCRVPTGDRASWRRATCARWRSCGRDQRTVFLTAALTTARGLVSWHLMMLDSGVRSQRHATCRLPDPSSLLRLNRRRNGLNNRFKVAWVGLCRGWIARRTFGLAISAFVANSLTPIARITFPSAVCTGTPSSTAARRNSRANSSSWRS